jgi:hypothetical protein
MAGGRRQSLLEPEQEQQLARRWRELGDRKAADKLVTRSLGARCKGCETLQRVRTTACRYRCRSQSGVDNRRIPI